MPRKLTYEFVKEQFEKEGWSLVSKEYKNNIGKLKYICSEGHKGKMRWDNFRNGNRCLECSGVKKLTYEFVKEQFESYDYKLISKEYINARKLLEIKCDKDHIIKMTWSNFSTGYRCAECYGNKKHTIEYVKEKTKELAKEYECISDKYINWENKLKFKCDKNHIFKMNWNNFKRGQRCSICWKNNRFGKTAPNWKPHLTKEHRINTRNFIEYKEWRTAVYTRDDFTCQKCGQVGVRLNAHHIESYNNNPELRVELSNGITFCKDCHNDFHHNYGYGNNTNRQLKEFLNGN